MKVELRKLWCVTATIAAAATNLFLCSVSIGGLSHPGTWRDISDDGKYVFVMLSPLPINEDIRYPEDDEEIRDIRSFYPKSGLYLNDGSSKPLWEYVGEWRNNSVIVAPDGEHVIFPGAWIYDEYALNAVVFTRRGKTIRHYYKVEVIPQYLLKFALNGSSSPICTGTSFDREKMTYTIRTNQGEEFTFDVTTGSIINSRSPFSVLYALAMVVLLTLLAIPIAWWRWSRRKSRA